MKTPPSNTDGAASERSTIAKSLGPASLNQKIGNDHGRHLIPCPCAELHDPANKPSECRILRHLHCGKRILAIACSETGCAEAIRLINEQYILATAGAGGRVYKARRLPAESSANRIINNSNI